MSVAPGLLAVAVAMLRAPVECDIFAEPGSGERVGRRLCTTEDEGAGGSLYSTARRVMGLRAGASKLRRRTAQWARINGATAVEGGVTLAALVAAEHGGMTVVEFAWRLTMRGFDGVDGSRAMLAALARQALDPTCLSHPTESHDRSTLFSLDP